jgi:predicted metal-dependent enzyme (double-stranded beta helix superfamily)
MIAMQEQAAPDRLASFVRRLTSAIESRPPFHPSAPPADFLDVAAAALAELVAQGDWLPGRFRQPHPEYYQQYLLYRDPLERFSVVSFVWGPGQRTPIHDHQVWGLVGLLEGAERCTGFHQVQGEIRPRGPARLLGPGEVERLSPAEGDIHLVENAHADRISLSIHVYGADIGKVERWVFPPGQEPKPFISGYANHADNPPFPPLPM